MREFFSIGVDERFSVELSLKGYFSKEYQLKSVPNSNEFSKNSS